MASYLLCLTAEGGIPLFTRTKGDIPPLPFPVIGSLNGVHMFAANQGVKLLESLAEGAKVVWRNFHDSITLIFITSDDSASDVHLSGLLEYIFNGMVLLLGIEKLTSIRSVELLKRDLKCCYSMIDALQEGCDLLGDLTQAVDVILCPDVSVLQEQLDAFVAAVSSEFGCLLIMGKVAVATERWWELTGIETVLLSLLVHCLPPCSSRDVPIYLPYGSPRVPHRLLTFKLFEGIEICVICGPSPPLQTVDSKYLGQYWSPAVDTLRTCLRSHPRNLPPSIALDGGILGFILLNTEERKCLSTVFPAGVMTGSGQSEGSKRKATLVSFYKSIVGSFFPPPRAPTSDRAPDEPSCDLYSSLGHQAMETYMCMEEYKCYACRTATHLLCTLFSADVPTYALGPVTNNTLHTLTKDRLV